MIKTPQYKLGYGQSGDLYSASVDLDRNVVIDNELAAISGIVSDGVLSGWNVSSGTGLNINVSAGSGFINGIYHRTFSRKTAAVQNGTNYVYMQSRMISQTGSLTLEAESPMSNTATVTVTDSTPPAMPTSFVAVAVDFDTINLTWAANAEPDLSHYRVYRSTSISGPFLLIASPKTNGISPSAPFQDSGLSSATLYYYRLSAVDLSGNESTRASSSDTTLPDIRRPSEISSLSAYPSDSSVSLVYAKSSYLDDLLLDYQITIEKLSNTGIVVLTTTVSNGKFLTYQAVGLTNQSKYRFTVKTRSVSSVLSNGTSVESTPSISAAPLDVTGVSATSGVKAITLSWSPSSSLTGSSIGQKNKYRIRVITAGVSSFPIDVGLAVTRKITSFSTATSVGAGVTKPLGDGTEYTFRISSMDSFGNESAGVYFKATTLDTTPPNDVRSLDAQGLDSSISLSWKHSSSSDVVGYNISINTGSGFGADILTQYVQAYVITGLTNGVLTTCKIRARDGSGNLSAGLTIVAVPTLDTIPPEVPKSVTATSMNTEILLTWNPSVAPDFSYFTVKRVAVSQSINAKPGQVLTPVNNIGPSSGEIIRNVGTSTILLDVGLVNGQTYAYYVSSTDSIGNTSAYSGARLVQPSEGVTAIAVPVLSGSGGTSAVLSWTTVTDAHSAYNIYRSDNSVYGFEYVDSVSGTTTSFTDSVLAGGTYYYRVTAVLDNAEVVVDTGVVPPPQSVLLGVVKAVSGSITSLVNSQRIVAQLLATITDETTKRILAHRHSVTTINKTTVQCSSLLAMVDAVNLPSITLSSLPLSANSLAYYSSMLKTPNGKAVVYDQGTTFFVSPSSIVGGLPFVGDFQLLVDGAIPTVPFSIDDSRNCIVFPVAIDASSAVTISGGGLTYYAPVVMDNGLDVLVNGIRVFDPTVDRSTQVVRFSTQKADSDIVSVSVSPKIPDFGNANGSKQVSLDPNIVLNDFDTVNGILFASESGAFDDTDTVFVLVNGVRTTVQHGIDFQSKSIVFANALPDGTSVALEIKNRQEVRNTLPPSRIGGLDGYQIGTGQFIEAQLPTMSHEGRISELAVPFFEIASTTNKYEYSGTANVVGTGTTPYALFMDDFGQLTVGTSNGVLRTSGFDNFVSGSDSSLSIDSTTVNGITFSRAATDDVVKAAQGCVGLSGKFNGTIPITLIQDGVLFTTATVSTPSLALLEDGRVLVCGGEYWNEDRAYYFETTDCFIYDPATQAMSKTGRLGVARVAHTAIPLPNGNVLVAGGAQSTGISFSPDTGEVVAGDFIKLNSCEVFDIGSQTWSAATSMLGKRSSHCCTVLSADEIVISGGVVSDDSFDDRTNENSGPSVVTKSCELYNISAGSPSLFTTAATGSLNRPRSNPTSSAVNGSIVVENNGTGRELYTRSTEEWTLVGGQTEQQGALTNGLSIEALDGVVRLFFEDSENILYAVTRNSIFFATDKQTFVKMKGLDSVGIVHALGEHEGTLFAATDLGVYEITQDIKAQYTWFQGGLIGAGTTETFDLLSFGGFMYAATEIGLFKTNDDGDTWVDLAISYGVNPIGDIYNLQLSGDSTVFLQSDDRLFKSTNLTSWSFLGRFSFLTENSSMLARANLDLFVASETGLWVTNDGTSFELVDFDRNRKNAANNVSMIELFGTDVLVGYDNEIYSIDPELNAIRLAQFAGTVPTVRIDGVEARKGFVYDNQRSEIVFEFKRLASETVTVATGYSDYYLSEGEWYSQGPDAPVTIFVNGREQDFSLYSAVPRLGKVSFVQPLNKPDVVTVSISNVTLSGAGEFYHSELEDRLSKEGDGLSLGLSRDSSCNVLQLGLGFEHNFLERGLERNQYYCLNGSYVDRSFNSFLVNSQFYIMGRRDFDSFNSTMDYMEQSSSGDIGKTALVPLSIYEYSPTQLWVGTEDGIFVLNPSTGFSISRTLALIPGSVGAVNGIVSFNGNIWVASDLGIFSTDDAGATFSKNPGGGLPGGTYAIAVLSGIVLVGTDKGIYYSDATTSDPAFSNWSKCSFVDSLGQEIVISTPCYTLVSNDNGIAYAGIDGRIFFSADGKVWTRAFVYESGTVISCMTEFSNKLYVGTNLGLWTDNGSTQSGTAAMSREPVANDVSDQIFSVNDVFAGSLGLYTVGDRGTLYKLQNGVWTGVQIPGETSANKVYVTLNGNLIVISNDVVLADL